MFERFLHCHRAFHEGGVEDPLLETLRLFDLLSNGAIRREIKALSLEKQGIELADVVIKRKEGVPLEYTIGRATFMGLDLLCSPDTLVPREETELLAKTVIELTSNMGLADDEKLSIIDMGTGCGNIAVALAVNLPDARIAASDVSPAAVAIALKNVERFGLQDSITVYCGDLFDSLQGLGYEGNNHIVVCNPPYIPTGSLSKLEREVIDYEPILALDAGTYGINIFRRLITEAATYLRPQGTLVFEIGAGQDKLVRRLLEKSNQYGKIGYFRDEKDVIRVISAVKARS